MRTIGGGSSPPNMIAPDDVFQIVLQLLVLHSFGVIHHDIKPAQLLLFGRFLFLSDWDQAEF